MADSDVLNPLVPDLEGLFRYSGQLDQLRDSAAFLHEAGEVSAATTAHMVSQYLLLREKLKTVMREDVASEIDVWSPELRDDAGMDLVYFAAAALARWCDLVHQTTQFLLAQQVGAANAAEVGSKVAEALSRRVRADRDPILRTAELSPGQYL